MSKINLRAKESEKFKDDGQWFKDYMNYIIPYGVATIPEYDKLKSISEIINNDLNSIQKQLDAFCSPLGEDVGEVKDTILGYPLIYNNLAVLKGESLKRNSEFKILILSAKALKEKNNQLLSLIQKSVDEKINLEIQKVQQQLEGKSEEEINQYIESIRTQVEPEDINIKNFQSEWEIFYNHASKYCTYTEDLKFKRMDTLEDLVAYDRCYIYSGFKNGKPHIEVRNPLFVGFKKNPNQMYIEKSDCIWYKRPITLAEAMEEYPDLSEEDIDKLANHSSANLAKNPSFNIFGNPEPVLDTFNYEMHLELDTSDTRSPVNTTTGAHQDLGTSRAITKRLIWETHFEFKAFREVIFLSYYDDYNTKVTEIVPDDYEIPKDAVKEQVLMYGNKLTKFVWMDPIMQKEYSAVKLYIPRKYEIVRLGTDIFPVIREVPNQHISIENPYTNFELSTKGVIVSSKNAYSISLVERAIPSYLQALYVKHIQNRELAKYQGAIQAIDVDQIPDTLGEDEDGEKIRDKVATFLTFIKKTGRAFYSGSASTNGGLPPATRTTGVDGFTLGTAAELMNLQNLFELLDREVGLAMGVPPQRKAEFLQYTTSTDNSKALEQSSIITEPYFYLHNEVWKKVVLDYLYNFRTYCESLLESGEEDLMFNYYLSDGTIELFKVTPKHLDLITLGLYISSSDYDRQYNQTMLQLAQAFAQNAGEGVEQVSELIKSILSGTSPEETHKKIQTLVQRQQQNARQQQEAQLKSQEKIAEMQNENREDLQKHQYDMQERRYEHEKEIKAMDIYKYQQDLDVNKDNVLDPIAAMEAVRKMNLEDRKISNDERSQMFEEKKHSDQMEMKSRELEIKKTQTDKKTKE